jgi:nucleotidyltransferase/DNA polymerase involved in DNA repair
VFSEPILHVDMDAFFVEVERLRRPELRGVPVVVGGDGPRSVVAAASYEARRFGVRSAMPMVEARRRCRDLTIVPVDHGEYGRVSTQVFEILRGFTPLVEGLSIDEAFLDVSGLRLHHGSPAEVGDLIRSEIRAELGLPASVGVATCKFVAKLASQDAKPDGLLVVPAAGQQAYLDALPVSRMWGVGAATAASLARLGVVTVADLSACGDRVLARELGASMAGHLLRLARGDDPRPVVPDSETKSISAEETFAVDLHTVDEVMAILRRQADRVGGRLRRAGLAGRTVTVKIRYGDFTTMTRSETLPAPTDGGIRIFEVAKTLVHAALEEGRGVRLLGVGVSSLVAGGEPVQLTVDDDTRHHRIDVAMDALRERFGPGVVGPGSQAPDPSSS